MRVLGGLEPRESVATVADCLALPSLRGGRLRGGEGGLHAGVRWASTAADGSGCAPGEFRLVARLGDPDIVERAADAGAVALAAPFIDDASVAAATRRSLPVIELTGRPGPSVVAAELLDFVIAALDTSLASLRRVTAVLAAAACDDLRVESIAEALAAATGAPVLIEDAAFRLLCAVGEGEVDPNRTETIRAGGTPARFRGTVAMRHFYAAVAKADRAVRLDPDPEIGLHLPRLVAPVRAAGEVLGFVTLIVPTGAQAGRLCAVALDQAVHLVALAIVHGRARDLSGRLESCHLLLDLLDGRAAPELVAARAGRLGVELRGTHALALLAPPPGCRADAALQRVLGMLPPVPPPLCDLVGGTVVIKLAGDDRRAHIALVEGIRDAVGSPLALLSRAVTLPELPATHAETRRAMDMAARSQRTGTLDSDRLGLVGLLLNGTADGALERFATGRLAPLIAHDRSAGTDLCGSVGAFLDAGGLRAAARDLGVHPNSLAYRLDRAQAVGGFRLDSADDRLEIALALRCQRLLGG